MVQFHPEQWFNINRNKWFSMYRNNQAAADSIGTTILTEDIIPSPKGPYGESKLAAEQYLTERLKDLTNERLND